MNEDLIEVFSRNRRAKASNKTSAEESQPPPKVNGDIFKYYQPVQKPADAGRWLDRPELPTSIEIMDMDDDSSSSDVVEITPNKIEGPWESKGESQNATMSLHSIR